MKLVAFCDFVSERVEKTVKEFGVADAWAYTDYRMLLAATLKGTEMMMAAVKKTGKLFIVGYSTGLWITIIR